MAFGLSLPVSASSKTDSDSVKCLFSFKDVTQSDTNSIKSVGFNTLILTFLDVTSSGDLIYAGTGSSGDMTKYKVCTSGSYVGGSTLSDKIKSFKTAPTKINRVEAIIVGAAGGDGNFDHIKAQINKNGTGSATNLYKNFQALKAAWNLDAICNGDENTYDKASSVKFGQMLGNMGYHYSFCAYTNDSFWESVKNQLSGLVDRVYLQCYDGGSGNDPDSWQSSLGMKVIPLLWVTNDSKPYCGKTPEEAQAQFTDWYQSDGIAGGGYWNDYDIEKMGSSYSAYANALINSFNNVTPPQPTQSTAVSLTPYFNADGFSYDTARSDGNFDGANYTYSADLVAANPTYDGANYQFGPFADGKKNVVRCSGQKIAFTPGQYSSIRILGSAANGDKTGTFRILYSDSTYTDVSVTMKDWCTSSLRGQKVVQTMNHRHSNSADDPVSNRIFAYYLTPSSGKTVTGITCPNVADMNVLAVTLAN